MTWVWEFSPVGGMIGVLSSFLFVFYFDEDFVV